MRNRTIIIRLFFLFCFAVFPSAYAQDMSFNYLTTDNGLSQFTVYALYNDAIRIGKLSSNILDKIIIKEDKDRRGRSSGEIAELIKKGVLQVNKDADLKVILDEVEAFKTALMEAKNGDIIVLLGGRTGRDGCGGATGSSKIHTEQSIESCGAEVQKGNAPTERKLQRLFRREEVSYLIKKCNDFVQVVYLLVYANCFGRKF